MDQKEFFKLLKENFSSLDFSMWLKELDLSPKGVCNGVLHLVCYSNTKKEKIEKQFLPQLVCLANQCDKTIERVIVELEFVSVAKNAKNSAKSLNVHQKNNVQDVVASQKYSPLPIKSRNYFEKNNENPVQHLPRQNQIFSFENFVETKENSLGLSFAQKVVGQFSRYSPLYFYGPVGVGKTHLLCAIQRELSTIIPANRMKFITPDRFVGEFSAALRSKRDAEFRARYHALDLLIIDDIQFFMGKEKTSIEFFHIFNSIYCPGKQMLFASDRSPSDLGGIDGRLKSRLSSSAIVELSPPSLDSRRKIFSFYAKQYDLTRDEKIFDYIARNIGGDVRKILGIVRTLAAIRDVQSREVTMDDCCRVLSALSVHERFVVRAEDVLASVEKYYNILPVHWQLKRKDRFFKQAFHSAAHLLKKHCSMGITQIARHIHCKPYSVVYSLKVMEKKLVSHQKIATAITEIEKNLVELD